MARIFNDDLQITDCSGLYTLMGYVNGTWVDVYTIAGTMDGDIPVDASENTITVDTTVFVPGNSYSFKWVDANGVQSNVTRIYIAPALLNEDGSSLLSEQSGLTLLDQ